MGTEAVAMDCEGDLDRGGSVALVQLLGPGGGPAYVFDLHAAPADQKPLLLAALARLLEAERPLKASFELWGGHLMPLLQAAAGSAMPVVWLLPALTQLLEAARPLESSCNQNEGMAMSSYSHCCWSRLAGSTLFVCSLPLSRFAADAAWLPNRRFVVFLGLDSWLDFLLLL